MTKASCIVHKGNRVLMVQHRTEGREWWCLPGGTVEAGETPAEAALRELREECGLEGAIVRQLSVFGYSNTNVVYTYLVDVDRQRPRLGRDPEFGPHEQALVDVKWLALNEIPERDRAFLWAGGLLGVKEFLHEVSQWGDEVSYPFSGT